MTSGALPLQHAASSPGLAQAGDQVPTRKASEALVLTGKNARVESGKKFSGDALYAGSDSCKTCDTSQYQSWATT